jgi:hypothetical protein
MDRGDAVAAADRHKYLEYIFVHFILYIWIRVRFCKELSNNASRISHNS